MAFWSDNIEPLRKYAFRVLIDGKFDFLVKTANKPTLETDVNEYRLINQINKFPSIPKWNDITIKYVDTKDKKISNKLIDMMLPSNKPSSSWTANAIEKKDIKLKIEQISNTGEIVSTWSFKNPFIRSINFGDLDYTSDDFVEVDITIAYDWAYLT